VAERNGTSCRPAVGPLCRARLESRITSLAIAGLWRRQECGESHSPGDPFLDAHWLAGDARVSNILPELLAEKASRPTSFQSLAFCTPLSPAVFAVEAWERMDTVATSTQSVTFAVPQDCSRGSTLPPGVHRVDDGFRSPALAIGPDRQDFTPIREKLHWASFSTSRLGSVALSSSNFPNENPEATPSGM
jgi:hypothetical protein